MDLHNSKVVFIFGLFLCDLSHATSNDSFKKCYSETYSLCIASSQVQARAENPDRFNPKGNDGGSVLLPAIDRVIPNALTGIAIRFGCFAENVEKEYKPRVGAGLEMRADVKAFNYESKPCENQIYKVKPRFRKKISSFTALAHKNLSSQSLDSQLSHWKLATEQLSTLLDMTDELWHIPNWSKFSERQRTQSGEIQMAAARKFIENAAVSSALKQTSLDALSITSPVGALGHTCFPHIHRETTEDRRYSKAIKLTAKKVIERVANKDLSGDVFTDIRQSFSVVDPSLSTSQVDEMAMKVMGLIGTRGQNVNPLENIWGFNGDFGQLLGLSVITQGMTVLDRIAIHQRDKSGKVEGPLKLYSYPPGVKTACDYARPYHFWQSAFIAHELKKKKHNPTDSFSAVHMLGALYEAGSNVATNENQSGRPQTIETRKDLYFNGLGALWANDRTSIKDHTCDLRDYILVGKAERAPPGIWVLWEKFVKIPTFVNYGTAYRNIRLINPKFIYQRLLPPQVEVSVKNEEASKATR